MSTCGCQGKRGIGIGLTYEKAIKEADKKNKAGAKKKKKRVAMVGVREEKRNTVT